MSSLRRLFPDTSANNLPYQDFSNPEKNSFFQLVMDPSANRHDDVINAIHGQGFSESSEGCDNPSLGTHIDCYESTIECPQAITDAPPVQPGCGVQTTPVDLYRCANANVNSTAYNDVAGAVQNACAAPASSGGLSGLELGLIIGLPAGILFLLFFGFCVRNACINRNSANPAGFFNNRGNNAELNIPIHPVTTEEQAVNKTDNSSDDEEQQHVAIAPRL
jgi:hypothetical protein